MFGIQGLEIYFPKTCIQLSEFQKMRQFPADKYPPDFKQLHLSFAEEWEDINSISLTVVNNLLRNYNVHPSQVGRLEIGTSTLFDKSKSTKTVLMNLFKGNHDIQGTTSLNACYGGTNALINTLNWISSPFWDGRYGIVVTADIMMSTDFSANSLGGVGAVAMLIGPNGKIVFNKERSTYIEDTYDYYKPNPASEYPIVVNPLVRECYTRGIEECYKSLKEKEKNKNILSKTDYFCFHAPFAAMIELGFAALMKMQYPNLSEAELITSFKEKVQPSIYVFQRIGNIGAASLYSCLVSLLLMKSNIKNKNIMLFSYGSGSCSTILTAKVFENPLLKGNNIIEKLQKRIFVTPYEFQEIEKRKEQNYGKLIGKFLPKEDYLDDNVFYLSEIDQKMRKKYQIKNPKSISFKRKIVSSTTRLQNTKNHLAAKHEVSKFYKLSVDERLQIVSKDHEKIEKQNFQNGGLSLDVADTMIENVIGVLSLPLAIVPTFMINKKKYMIPMCIQEPSVVAACSSIGKLLSPFSFFTSSTPNIMIGQLHLPSSQTQEIHQIISQKSNLINELNKSCNSMVMRGGGVLDLRIRELGQLFSKQYCIDIVINVCEAMGANITNMICEKAKEFISSMGIRTGIAILTNYCIQRRALSWFQIPITELGWKGVNGYEVALKILQAYQFAKNDQFRAVTHNKGIMNGIDSVCVATGQDWRAVESSAHAYASRAQSYQPLTHYEIIERDKVSYFKGSLELPISVGSKGGVIEKNPLYKSTMQILKNPSAQQLSQILVSIGLAQNFGALRALAVQGIQKGHMVLHVRSIAQKAGTPKDLIDKVCKQMTIKKKYDVETAKSILSELQKPKL